MHASCYYITIHNIPLQVRSEYTTENVTNFIECANQHMDDLGFFITNDTNRTSFASCGKVQDYIQEFNLTCENATTYDRRYVRLHPRSGMNILGIIIFTIAFGIALSRLGEEGRAVIQAVDVLNRAIMKLVYLVMW